MKNVSEAKFTGVIAFKNGNAALQMQLLVNTIIDKSVNIFSSKRTFAPSQLIDDLDKMLKLSENFVEYASTEENSKLEAQLLREMSNHVDKLRDVVRNFNGKAWTLSQSQIIAETMKEVFQRLEKLTEKNEEDHVRKALKQTGTAKSCQTSLAYGTDYDPSNWQILLKNYTTMQNILFSMMENRASVTKDENKKKEILDLRRRIKLISDKLPDMCEEARRTNFPLDLMERIGDTGVQLVEHTEQFEEILMFGIECFSSFKHTPIEPEKFGEQLDDLVNAIQSGNSQGFMSAARNLTSEVGNIKNRELLDNETKLLNEQTKQLLINAREVLKDNDKENAKKKMNDLAAILKKNVQDLALQEKQMMNSKKKLSKQATGLGLAMQNMGQVLTNITGNEMVSNSPLFKSKSEKEFEEIEKNLGELEFEKDQPRKTSNSSPFTNTKNTRSPPFIPKSSDLDDLEKDLEEIEITPLKNPKRTSGHFVNDNNLIIEVNSRVSRGSRGSRRSRNSGNELEELEDLEKELDEMESAPKRKSYTYATSRTTIEPRKSTFTTIQEESTSIDELELLERELEDL